MFSIPFISLRKWKWWYGCANAKLGQEYALAQRFHPKLPWNIYYEASHRSGWEGKTGTETKPTWNASTSF